MGHYEAVLLALGGVTLFGLGSVVWLAWGEPHVPVEPDPELFFTITPLTVRPIIGDWCPPTALSVPGQGRVRG